MQSSPKPLRWSKLADTAGHRLRVPAAQTTSSSIGSVQFLSSKFHADTCNIDESTPSIFGATQAVWAVDQKTEYFFQGTDAKYIEEWKISIAAAKKKFRRRSQYGRQTSAGGTGGSTSQN